MAYLLLGRSNEAIADLRTSVDLDPTPATWSDLSAAYLEAARNLDRWAESQARALDAAEMALHLQPALPEARFNRDAARQLVLDATGQQASWLRARKLLDGEPTADERARLAREFTGALREHLEERALPLWGERFSSRTEAERERGLVSLQQLADAHATATGDGFFRLAVGEIRDARGAAAFAEAHRLYGRARELIEQAREGDALTFARGAASQLPSDAVFQLPVRLLVATVDYQARRLAESRASCESLLAESRRRGFGLMEARVRILLGLIRLQQGELVESVDEFEMAGRRLESYREPDLTVTAYYTQANTLRTSGEDLRAWRAVSRALEHLDELANLRRRQMVLYNASMLAQEGALWRAALWYQTATLDTARARAVAGSISEAHARRAMLLGRLGQLDAARLDLDAARTALSEVTDSSRAAYYRALLDAGEGELSTDPVSARVALFNAISFFRHVEPGEVPRLYLFRGQAGLRQGDPVAARADFAAGVEFLESARARVSGELERVSYFDESWSLFRELVQLSRRNPDEAFAFAERGRARTLLDRVGAASLTLNPAAIAKEVPENTALIQFSVLPDALLVWVITRDHVRFIERPIAERELERRSVDVVAALQSGDRTRQIAAAVAKFYEVCVAPIAADVKGIAHLVIVPDGPLSLVPFSALRDPATGRYVVEDHTIAYAPSANYFLASRRSSTPSAARAALVIGSPRFDRRAYPDLADLPAAAVEAQRIGGLYQHPSLLMADAATLSAVVPLLSVHDVIHFAGHSIVNEDYPSNSALLLASDGDRASTLRIADIYRIRLRAGAVVVLGACSTARGASFRLEGVQSMARAFLATGAGAIVASLWDVEDNASESLLVQFHRELSAGTDPLTALAKAQRRMLRASGARLESTQEWAAFVAIGASGAPADRHTQ